MYIWHSVLIWCISVPSYLKISLWMKKLLSGQEQFNWCLFVVTLTLKLQTKVLHVTHHIDIVHICAKLFENISAWHSYGPYKKSSIKVYFLSLWPWPWIYIFVFAFGTLSWYGACLCQVIWKYLCMTKLWSGQEKFN